MILEIPDDWRKFILEWDSYRNLYETFCITEDWWYKGLGPTPEASLAQLKENVKHRVKLGSRPASHVNWSVEKRKPALDVDLSDINI